MERIYISELYRAPGDYAGKEITKARPHQVAQMGIGRTFQLNPLFGEFTVFENVGIPA